MPEAVRGREGEPQQGVRCREGVGRAGGLVVFVPFTIPSEQVTVEITRESRQAWFDEHPEERAKLKQQGGTVAR